MGSTDVVSCVIRTLNEQKHLGRCLETLLAQEGTVPLEIIIVDSGSIDRTLSIAREYDVTILTTEGADLRDFDYSRALNRGIEASRGDFVVILSAHAIPTGRDWLRHLSSRS